MVCIEIPDPFFVQGCGIQTIQLGGCVHEDSYLFSPCRRVLRSTHWVSAWKRAPAGLAAGGWRSKQLPSIFPPYLALQDGKQIWKGHAHFKGSIGLTLRTIEYIFWYIGGRGVCLVLAPHSITSSAANEWLEPRLCWWGDNIAPYIKLYPCGSVPIL